MMFHVSRINLESHFAWQVQYLLKTVSDFVAPHNVSDVSFMSRINHECYFVVQSSTGVVLE